MKGHTKGSRLEICALRPAPIQISYLGFPGSIGANFIDYLIADTTVIPPHEQKYYTEKILYLPNCYQPAGMQHIANLNYSREDFNIPQDAIVYCCFNQLCKIEEHVFMAWVEIIKQTPNSILWLLADNKIAMHNLQEIFRQQQLDPGRIIFSNRITKSQHLSRLKLADIALDTFIYNGHTTTTDALLAGIPVITTIGNHFASRVSASLLRACNLPELITKNIDEYKQLAISLGNNQHKLHSIITKLKATKHTAALFNAKQFALNIESIYTKVWKNYLQII